MLFQSSLLQSNNIPISSARPHNWCSPHQPGPPRAAGGAERCILFDRWGFCSAAIQRRQGAFRWSEPLGNWV